MRYLLQFLGLLIIVNIGWNQPFCDVARTLLPWAQIPPSRLSLIKAKAKAGALATPAFAATPRGVKFGPANGLATPVHH